MSVFSWSLVEERGYVHKHRKRDDAHDDKADEPPERRGEHVGMVGVVQLDQERSIPVG